MDSSDEVSDIEDLVALFEDDSDSNIDEKEQEGRCGENKNEDLEDQEKNCTEFFDGDEDDYGIEVFDDDKIIQENCDTDKRENLKKHEADDTKQSDEDEIQSLKDEISATRAKLAILEGKLADKKRLRDAKKTEVARKEKLQKLLAKKEEDDKASNLEKARKGKGTNNPLKKKERIAHAPKNDPKMDRSGIDNIHAQKKKMNIDMKAKPKQKPKEDEPIWQTELFSGIRIVNPRISSQQMESKMEGRKFIKLHMIPHYINRGEINGDWVTIGVITKKVLPQTAANGKTFSIWRLSDLAVGKENEFISFFLFGDVYKEHWKMADGNVIALLNASIMPKRDSDDAGAYAITLDNPKKLMVIGTSKDLACCKGITKGGKHCSYIVNKFHGEFCEYHVSNAHKKLQSNRMELQSGSNGPEARKGRNMHSLKKEIQSGQVYYGGHALNWKDKNETKKKAETKKVTLDLLKNETKKKYISKETPSDSCSMKSMPFEDEELLPEEFKERLKVPTLGSRNLMKFLQKDEEEEKQKTVAVKQEVKSAKDLIKEEKALIKQRLKPVKTNVDINKVLPKPKSSSRSILDANFKPIIGGGHDDDDFIDFGDSDDIVSNSLNSKKELDSPTLLQLKRTPLAPKSLEPNAAKNKAIALLRGNKIKISPEPTDIAISKKRSPEAVAKINERVRKDISSEDSENCEPAKKRQKGLLDDALGVLDLQSEEGKRILKTESAYIGRVRQAEAEREAAYFNVLEKKEMYEEKMKNITELKTNVVCCKICKYMHEYQSNYCKEQGHPTMRVEATKRFFMCKNCRHRTTSFKKLPVQPCSNCQRNDFERTSMYYEKKGPNVGAETLQVRGEEHSRFLNSLK